jgi:hypothetical protein
MNLANGRYAMISKFLFERRKNHLLSGGHCSEVPKNIMTLLPHP